MSEREIPEPPGDGHVYGRRPGDWEAVMPLLGGTMLGPLHLWNASPQRPEEAASKAYVDQKFENANGGGSMLRPYSFILRIPGSSDAILPAPSDAVFRAAATQTAPVTAVVTFEDGTEESIGITESPLPVRLIKIRPSGGYVYICYYDKPTASAQITLLE